MKKPVRTKRLQPERARPARAGGRRKDEIRITVNGVGVKVSPELDSAVRRAVAAAARTLPAEMTTTQAAEFLDVSRPFVVKLVQQSELPCRMVGSHRRIPTDAIQAYREKMYRHARAAAHELAQASQKLGLYDDTEFVGAAR